MKIQKLTGRISARPKSIILKKGHEQEFLSHKNFKNCLKLIATKNSSRVTYEVGVETYQKFVFLHI